MNDMEQLENQLRSWAPRRPSARLERRLFGDQAVVALEGSSSRTIPQHGARFAWLAPAMAGFALICMLFNQRPGGTASSGTNSGHFLAVISSNQSSYLASGISRQQNRPATDIFESTNDNNFTSSVRFLLGPKAQH
jgi:hypothetical protein